MNSTSTEIDFSTDITVKEFCDNKLIPYVNIFLDKNAKKSGKPLKRGEQVKIPAGWDKWDYETCMAYNHNTDPKCNAINVNLFKGKIVIIDCDSKKSMEAMFKKYGNDNVSKSTGRGMPHIWFNRDDFDGDTNSQSKLYDKVDVLYKNSFEDPNGYILNVTELSTFKDYKKKNSHTSIKVIKKKISPKPIDKEVVENKNDISSMEREIIDNINNKYIDNYQDWLKLIWGIYNHTNDIKLCLYLSKKTRPDETEKNILAKINSDKNENVTWGTVCYYSKLSNKTKYLCIQSKYNDLFNFDGSDFSFAELFFKIDNGNFIKNGGVIYHYDNPFWKLCDKDDFAFSVGSMFRDFIEHQILMTEEDRKEKLKQLAGLRLSISNVTKMLSVARVINSMMKDSDIEFDNLANYFCFKNETIDLNTHKKVTINREDYISINCGYNKLPSTPQQREILHDILTKIFPVEEELNSFYTLAKVTLFGEQDKHFHVFRGNGCNGKGFLCETFEKVMGNYYSKPNKEFLLKSISTGTNEILCAMDRCRLLNFTELSKDDIIKADVLKVLTDCPTMQSRGIYEKQRTIHLQGTSWLDTNPEVNIDGDVDESISRRLVYWFFRSTFTKDQSLLGRAEHIYIVNEKFKEVNFILEHRSAWFDLILEKTKPGNKLILCDSILAKTKEALTEIDDITELIEPLYERTGNKNDYILVRDMYNKFKQTEEYEMLPREQKIYKRFKNSIIKNIRFIGDHRAKTDIDGKSLRDVVKNWREL